MNCVTMSDEMNRLLMLWNEPYDDKIDYLNKNDDGLLDKSSAKLLDERDMGIPGLSRRKAHELSQLIPRITKLIDDRAVEFIIDIGSGKSYLSRVLSRKCEVICVEHDAMRIKSSKRLDALQGSSIAYISNLDQLSSLERHVLSRKKHNDRIPNALIVGLDVCGDLPLSTARFLLDNEIQFLDIMGMLIIPCCFHKITRLLTMDIAPPTWLSSQDLRHLTKEELMEIVDDDINYLSYQKLWKSLVFESMVLEDLSSFLDKYNTAVEPIFDFQISSRNLMLMALNK